MNRTDEAPLLDHADRYGRLTRREAIQRVAILLGSGSFVGGQALISACTSREALPYQSANGFTASEIALLDEIAETMLPETATPGAKAAGVGPFMAVMVADAYSPAERDVFRAGMVALDDASTEADGVPFLQATPGERRRLLERLDREQFDYMNSRSGGEPVHYFRMMKELALLGYFTSEIGCTIAQRYIEAPGRFDPCVDYAPGERAWAPHA